MVISNSNFTDTALYTVPNRGRKLLKRFYADTVLTRLMNREYEGELKKMGNKVTVPQRPVITIGDWTNNKTYTYPELTSAAAKELVIDQAPDFEFSINDIDKIQAYIKGFDGDWLDEANNRLRIKVETQVLNAAGAKVAAANTGNAAGGGSINVGSLLNPVFLTSEKSYVDAVTNRQYVNVVKYITNCKTVLDKQNITQSLEHFTIGDPMLGNLLANSDIKAANITGDGKGVIRGGPDHVGVVQGMQTYQSTLFTPLAGGANGELTVYPVLFGVSDAWSFAAQMTDFWSDKLQTKAAMGYRGVMIYGWEVMIPEALGCGYVCFDGSL